MATLKIKLPAARDIIIPSRSANIIIDSGSADAALVYIYVLSHSGELDLPAAGKRMNMSEDRIMSALALLERKGLIGKTEPPKLPDRSDAVPEYSQTDVAEHLGSDKSFKHLVNFCEETLGKLLSTVDLQVLLGIYSWLGLPIDVICLLITSCLEETRKKFGDGRVPTMRTIEKRAKIWVRDGVVTLGIAEEYIKRQEKLGQDKNRVSAILGISGRALSPTEERYISEWLALGITDELIAAAYDKTVVNTGSLKWNYMNKILTTWHELGYTTVADTQGETRSNADDTARDDEDAYTRLLELNRRKQEKCEV